MPFKENIGSPSLHFPLEPSKNIVEFFSNQFSYYYSITLNNLY